MALYGAAAPRADRGVAAVVITLPHRHTLVHGHRTHLLNVRTTPVLPFAAQTVVQVILFNPGYPWYLNIARVAGATPVLVELRAPSFAPDMEEVRGHAILTKQRGRSRDTEAM